MLPIELVTRIRRVHIRAKRIVNELMAGEYTSAFKGLGLEFEEVREYEPGDDIRTIDWNVTARYSRPFVKVFREERELSVYMAVDMSASQEFGTTRLLKRELSAELAAVLSFAATISNDKVSLLLFTDMVELFVPPRKGSTHVWRIIKDILTFTPKSQGTSVRDMLSFLMMIAKRGATVFIISDFQDHGYESILRVASRKYDIIPICVFDDFEESPHSLGLIEIEDPESGDSVFLDLSSGDVRAYINSLFHKRKQELEGLFKSLGLDFTFIKTSEDYVLKLLKLFRMRERRFKVV